MWRGFPQAGVAGVAAAGVEEDAEATRDGSEVCRAGCLVVVSHICTRRGLGGDGSATVPITTTERERRALGELIRRYRASALTWCGNALTSAAPAPGDARWRDPRLSPVQDLARALRVATAADVSNLPSLEELAAGSTYPLVEAWREMACAAALGEHDLAAPDMKRGHLSLPERAAVAHDASDVLRGLCVLDERYKLVPGWSTLAHRGDLIRRSRQCSIAMEDLRADVELAARGHRSSAMIDGPALPGIEGVLQAQHNQLVALGQLPTVLNLRRIFHGQWALSAEAARRAGLVSQVLSDRWEERAAMYRRLVEASRDMGGLAGGGGRAAVEGSYALSRLRRLPTHERFDQAELHRLGDLFDRTDARLRSVIEEGIRGKCYLAKVSARRLSSSATAGTTLPSHHYVPIREGTRVAFLDLVRNGFVAQAPSMSRPTRAERRQHDPMEARHLSAAQGLAP